MKNILAKATSAMLTVTITLGSCIFTCLADNSSSTPTVSDYETQLLLKLGIIDEDSLQNTTADITRGEFSEMLTGLMGLAGGGNAIEELYNLGIVNGYGSGSLKETRTITTYEAVKMIICALGYKPLAEHEGGYPLGYVKVAYECDLLKGAVSNVALTTENALRLIIDAGNTEMAAISNAAIFGEADLGGDTMFYTYFDVVRYTGILTANGYTTLGDVVAENFDISSSKWTRVSGRVKIEANNAQGTYQGINIGFSTGGTTAVYIDKYELREFYPEFTITTTPENGAIAITTETIKFKFSSELKTDLTEANFTITPSAPVESITKISSTEYDVKFDFDYNTHYKIEFNDLENKTFQFVSQVIEFSTSSGGGAADNNILAQYGFDWQADKGANGTEVPKVDFTAADGTTKQIYWDTSVYNKGQKPLISNADSYSGTGSILISDTTPDEYTWNFVKRRSRISYFPMEDGKTYVISAMLKLNDPMGIDSAQITFDLAGGEAASNLALLATSPKFEINGTEWTKVTATVDCTWKNKNITSDRPRTEAHVQIHNTSASYQFFIDDVIIYEVPTEPFILEGSNVADGETDASVSVGTIRFDYSQSLDENQNLNQDGLVTVWKGETNVTEDILNGQIVSGFGNKSVEVPLKALEHNSVYTIKISGLSSYAGKIAEDHQITFKTSKSVGYDDFVVLGDLGNQLAFENVPASEIHEISVNVSNLAIGTIKKPLIIYTIYDTATNQLIKVKTSTFDGDGSEVLADGAENQLIKLGVDAGDIQAGRRFTVYLVNGYDNTSLVAPPMTREF